MNPKTFGGSIWLLLFGTASVLLIGAFARFDGSGPANDPAADAPAPPPAVVRTAFSEPALSPATASSVALALPADLSPGLAEIIKLAQAHIPEDTILAYIQNSGQTYNPSAEEILYLSDLGLSDKVVGALLNKPDAAVAAAAAPPAPPAAAPAAETPPAPPAGNAGTMAGPNNMIDIPPAAPAEPPPLQNPQDSYFYDSLSPYGNWVQTADGWGWQPMVAAVDAGWMPYRDRGCWVLTDDGWYWASDYSWGWGPFHYGTWSLDGGFGWVWFPGDVWASAWVAWRNTTDGFAGWAPLPPRVHYRPGAGLYTASGLGGWNVSYGLSAASFTFVSQEHFLARNLGRFAAPAPRTAALFRSSTPVNNYSFAGGRILNSGVSAAQIAAATKATVPKFTMKEVSSPDAAAGKVAGRSLAVFRPNPAALGVRSPAEATAQPILINKTPRPATTEAAMPRAVPTRPAAVASDYSAQTPRSSSAASRGRPGFISSNFQPPTSRTTQSSASPAAPGAAWPPAPGVGDTRRVLSPSGPAPAVGYPSYNPRGVYPPPPPAPGTAPSYNSPQRNAPAYSAAPASAPAYNAPPSAPQHNAPSYTAPASAPAESHGGGGGQGGQGGGSAESGSSSGSSKPSK
jgi:hypothetical protein